MLLLANEKYIDREQAIDSSDNTRQAYFPSGYWDETLQSILSRWLNHTHHPNPKAAIQEILGTSGISTLNALPSHLDRLISVLPVGHSYNADQLIDQHTPLPFFTPFYPVERVHQLREDMKGGEGLKAYLRSGITSGCIRLPNFLRFCPICAIEDKERDGERYWHRLHQLPGVMVCLDHLVHLENSTVRTQSRRIRYELISAEEAIQVAVPRSLDLSSFSHQCLIKIASDANWLLNHPGLLPGLESIHNRYLLLLIDRGFANHKGNVRTTQLLEAFQKHYSDEFLRSLQSDLKGSGNWLLRLVRPPKHSQQPLHHLLLIHFLGHTAESFFQLSDELHPFGTGPWPCLNPVCIYYKQLRLKDYELKYDKTHGGRLTATFKCECGFTYSRMGPDSSTEDQFRVGKIKAWGHVWEELLKKLWEDSTVTLQEMATRLGADSQAVKYQAARLDLVYPRPGKTSKQIRKTTAPRPQLEEAVVSTKFVQYRDEWLAILAENPDAGRSDLSEKHRRVHSWLSFYDQEWLRSHLPPLKRRKPLSAFIDWQQRDADIAAAVRASAEKLRNTPGKPQKLTKTAIGSDSGYLALIQKQLDRLPLTAGVLSVVIETTEEFAIRQIDWAADHFRQKGIQPKHWQIVRHANLKPYIAEMAQVKTAITTVLTSFELIHSMEVEKC